MKRKEVAKLAGFEEKTIASQTLYEGKIVTLKVDDVVLPDGQQAKREIISHPGAVAMMAVTNEDRLVLVRQFRKALEKTILEIPAGKIEANEDPTVSAKRELAEETGYVAEHVKPLFTFYTSPGFANERLHLFWAENLHAGKMDLDQDEFVELVEYSLEDCLDAIERGEICDAKTVLAVQLWQQKK